MVVVVVVGGGRCFPPSLVSQHSPFGLTYLSLFFLCLSTRPTPPLHIIIDIDNTKTHTSEQFANCLTYTDPAGFSDALLHALSNEPSPMDEETLGRLSWESATQRLLDVTAIAPEQWPSPADERYAAMVWRMYRSVTGEFYGSDWGSGSGWVGSYGSDSSTVG